MTLILNGTNGLSDVDGDASTPAVRGTDANTGIFFPAADTIAFSEGGAEAMRINSSGNLLVNQTAETTGGKIDIQQAAGGTGLGVNAASGETALIYLRTSGGGTGGQINSNSELLFGSSNTERMRIDSSGNVNVGVPTADTSSNYISVTGGLAGSQLNAQMRFYGKSVSNTGATYETARISGGSTSPSYSLSGGLVFYTSENNGSNVLTLSERMRIDTSGNLLVGTTTSPSGSGNLAIGAGAWIPNTNYFQLVPKFTGSNGDYYFYDSTDGFFAFPDNYQKLGNPSYRWTTVYATTGTINTSDATTKQQIRSLNDAEKAVAQSIKGLIKAYKFNNSVAEKGDGARIHTGVIAQDVQAAFVAEGLDPTRYGLFCSDTWYEVDGKAKPQDGDFYTSETPNAIEVTRLGLRYEELLAFVIAAM